MLVGVRQVGKTTLLKTLIKELIKAPQIYFTDLGFRNYSLNLLGRVGELYNTGFLKLIKLRELLLLILS